MDDYIKGNKAAWEEAFDRRDAKWGADIVSRVGREPYAFFEPEAAQRLAEYDLRGKTIAQFCCNNGRELLSLTATSGAKRGVGFDIAANMVDFANAQAGALRLPCTFVQTNLLEIGHEYDDMFDFALITIGALCWFKDLDVLFSVLSRCVRRGGTFFIHEQHPLTNMLASEGDEGYDKAHPAQCLFSYFEHEWKGEDGMSYITGKGYKSKTFTDYTHSLASIAGALTRNGFVITGFDEFQKDIGGNFTDLNDTGLPLSMLIQARKE